MKYLHPSQTPLHITRTQPAHLYSCLVNSNNNNRWSRVHHPSSPPQWCEGRDHDDHDDDEGAIKTQWDHSTEEELPAPKQEPHASSRLQGGPGGSFLAKKRTVRIIWVIRQPHQGYFPPRKKVHVCGHRIQEAPPLPGFPSRRTFMLSKH